MSAPPLPSAPPAPPYSPLRADCPWCGSRRLRSRPRTALTGCADCRHVFRNPPAPPGPQGPTARACTALRYLLAARALRAHRPDPESWLDVRTGDARFPRTARRLFPYTSFDGLDPAPADRVLRARDAEHVEEAHVGRLTDPHVTARLRARYDVVSLLRPECCPDPRAELLGALQVLRPGGHLLLDTADPRVPLAHPAALRSAARLRAELAEHGCLLLPGTDPLRAIARAPGGPRPRSTSV
ncbi:methyltransferase domain-containing protein [Streptomyces sp. CRN 30]|uniref:methyltransferase domain-containing protein n=1 Tax=Streptomyces sp. CRN 30 TaxID=3075613 RepID=UPI002A83E208|nr:methyltransferase domain-containing protein [Streptomyces sp. CRN 30]